MFMRNLSTLPILFCFSAGLVAAPIEFNRDIRPILSDQCFRCHGFDAKTRKADLRLDDRDAAIAENDGFRAIVPGKPTESEMIVRIFSSDPDEVMPPPDSHKTLTLEQKDMLKRWIAEGAPYQPHWAYLPPKRPALPTAGGAGSIDALVNAKLAEKSIQPSGQADRRTLLRRLSLDLTGLPPTREEMQRFLSDASPDAYAKEVERLLASPHYGERMAVPWLDVVRFADTVGYHGDQNQRIFPYRDYVIEAFNRNKPFDQFTREQLAGDLLPNPTPDQLVATGFNRLNMMTREGGAQPKEYLAKYAADRVRTVSGAWLGSTLACAECHDHKYDPFSIKDFYELAAFFADVKQWGVYADYHYTPNPDIAGFGNDHPFPPEIQIESPYLQQREHRLRDETKRASIAAAAAKPNDFAAWRSDMTALVQNTPDGWISVSALENEKNKFRLDHGHIAAIQLRLPAEIRGKLKPRFELIREANGEPEKLSFRMADANRKVTRYSGSSDVLGILGEWQVGAGSEPANSIWLVEQLVDVSPGAVLMVSFEKDPPAQFSVSVSPIATLLPLDDRASFSTQLASDERAKLLWWASGSGSGEVKRLAGEIAECRNGKAWTMVTQAVPEPLKMRVLPRGNWQDESGEIVSPQTPHFLPRAANPEGRRLTRLDLANWLCAPENPLTARVFMNRLWKQFFGNAISAQVEDLGAQGEWPSHPELLDWLAVEFRESGWNVKHMVRLIVNSAAYRRDSNLRRELRDVDPSNRLLATQNPRRLEAEFVRDNALAISGLLNFDLGGPSAFPYQPTRYYEALQFPDRDYFPNKDERQYRRGLYSHWQRTFLHPMLANFDAPSREEGVCSRTVANTPQQALTLLNDPTFVEAARVFAARILSDRNAPDDVARIGAAFEQALGRPVKERERDSLLVFLGSQRKAFREQPDAARKLLQTGRAAAPGELDSVELAAWTSVCRVVLNLHETITRY
jgi:hypothetical protein